jgi:outer membrane protein, heavy metal efflux system
LLHVYSRSCLIPLLLWVCASALAQQTVMTWEQARAQFLANNPTLAATGILVDESKASEITAYLRPNPDFTATLDQLTPFTAGPYQPVASALPYMSASYLHERQHKRELRLDSAKQATGLAALSQADLQRNLVFSLRNAFVQTLQAKAVLQNAQENLTYWDREISLSRERFAAGDMAEVDLSRLQLQRVQYESDLETAKISLRTAKIQLLQLMNSRTPVDVLDVAGPYEFSEQVSPLEDVRSIALSTRPDLMSAQRSIEKARTDHELASANGSTDPTFAVDLGRNPPIAAYIGASVTIPVRIFDRNQGEKARTQLDIGRNEKLREASQAQVFSDVDSAYVALLGALNLLRPYKANYLPQAEKVRDIVAFSYQRGSASLLDFLDAQKAYRDIRLNYLNLIGSYLAAASQLNLAAGREVIP